MISSYLCYDIITAINLHFRLDRYDFFKYRGKTRSSKEKFQIKKDRHFYERLAAKCINEQDCVELIVSNIVANNFNPPYIKDISWGAYTDYKKQRDSLFYNFKYTISLIQTKPKKSVFFVESQDYSQIFLMLLSGEMPIEHFIILNHISNNKIVENYNQYLKDDIVWEDYKKKVSKYYPFLCYYWSLNDREVKSKLKEIIKETYKKAA